MVQRNWYNYCDLEMFRSVGIEMKLKVSSSKVTKSLQELKIYRDVQQDIDPPTTTTIKLKPTTSDTCIFCDSEVETTRHILCDCSVLAHRRHGNLGRERLTLPLPTNIINQQTNFTFMIV